MNIRQYIKRQYIIWKKTKVIKKIEKEFDIKFYEWQMDLMLGVNPTTLPIGRRNGKTLALALATIIRTEIEGDGALGWVKYRNENQDFFYKDKKIKLEYYYDVDYEKNQEWHDKYYLDLVAKLEKANILKPLDK